MLSDMFAVFPLKIVRTEELLRKGCTKLLDVCCRMDAVKNHGKLISTQTIRLMTFRAKLDHAVRHFNQHTIPGRMAPGVVVLKSSPSRNSSGIGLCRRVFHQRRNAVAGRRHDLQDRSGVMHRNCD